MKCNRTTKERLKGLRTCPEKEYKNSPLKYNGTTKERLKGLRTSPEKELSI